MDRNCVTPPKLGNIGETYFSIIWGCFAEDASTSLLPYLKLWKSDVYVDLMMKVTCFYVRHSLCVSMSVCLPFSMSCCAFG